MKTKEINFIKCLTADSYKLGYIEGIEHEKAENAKHVEIIKKELSTTQQRVQWWQDKYPRMQENYENQIKNLQDKIKNLQDKIKHLDEHINYLEELERRC